MDEGSVHEAADYLAPEQGLNSPKADARADIYALGCTMYYLLAGHPPFPDGSISERLLKHQIAQPPLITDEPPDAPPALARLCARMMSRKPGDRPQTAIDVASDLKRWLADDDRR